MPDRIAVLVAHDRFAPTPGADVRTLAEVERRRVWAADWVTHHYFTRAMARIGASLGRTALGVAALGVAAAGAGYAFQAALDAEEAAVRDRQKRTAVDG
jgi:hypothetical protein